MFAGISEISLHQKCVFNNFVSTKNIHIIQKVLKFKVLLIYVYIYIQISLTIYMLYIYIYIYI